MCVLQFVLCASVCGSVLEFLETNLWCRDLQRYLDADNRIWTAFLRSQPGFVRKMVITNPRDEGAANCSASFAIEWESRQVWKSIDPEQLEATDARFINDFGYKPNYFARPSDDGYDIVADVIKSSPPSSSSASTAPADIGAIVGFSLGAVTLFSIMVGDR
jgi:uncharacterized protein (TIGR03792 family)